jgi:sodium/hydrogen exchanger 8
VASLACGVTMNHFTKRNLTKEELDLSKQVFTLLSSLADCIIFFLVGINAVLYWTSVSFKLCFWMLLLCVIGRMLNIFPLTFLINQCSSREGGVPWNYAVIMWHSGLRGAIAFSIAVALPWQGEKRFLEDEIIGVVSFLIIVTVFVFGGTTQLMLGWMGIQCGVEDTHEAHVTAIKSIKKTGAAKMMMNTIRFTESVLLTSDAHRNREARRRADGTEMSDQPFSNNPSLLDRT